MRTCPTCGNSFSDELSYCLQDGTFIGDKRTGDITDRPTEIYHPETNQNTDISTAETIAARSGQTIPAPVQQQQQTGKAIQFSAVEPKSKMGCAISIGTVSGLAAVFIALGVVGLIFRGRQDSAKLGAPKQPPTANSVSSNAANVMQSGNVRTTPIATRTPLIVSTANTISGGNLTAKATSLPQPEYPSAARAANVSGVVTVRVLVDTDGRVIEASTMIGHDLLKAAAESAARLATFEPTKVDGEPVKVSGTIIYRFEPKN